MTYQQPYVPPRPTNGMAIAALVCGILGLVSCPLIGIVAIVLGQRARAEILRTGEEGDGMARVGVILGWIALALVVVALLIVLGIFAFSLFQAT